MTWKTVTAAAAGSWVLLALVTACGWTDGDPTLDDVAPAAGIAVPSPAQVSVFATASQRTAQVVLVWPAAPAVKTSLDGRALLLRFDRAFEAPLLQALPRRLDKWVQTVHATRDTILIRMALDVKVDVTVSGRQVTLDLTAEPPQPGETVIIGG
jgi:hypothetical protein